MKFSLLRRFQMKKHNAELEIDPPKLHTLKFQTPSTQ